HPGGRWAFSCFHRSSAGSATPRPSPACPSCAKKADAQSSLEPIPARSRKTSALQILSYWNPQTLRIAFVTLLHGSFADVCMAGRFLPLALNLLNEPSEH